jgi:hypothetical protein
MAIRTKYRFALGATPVTSRRALFLRLRFSRKFKLVSVFALIALGDAIRLLFGWHVTVEKHDCASLD